MPKQSGTTNDVQVQKKQSTPKTVIEKIIYAIRNQPSQSSSTGVSRNLIIKYLKSELDYDNKSALKIALKKGVETGKLIQTGQSFRIQGDPILESIIPEVKVKIYDIKEGNSDDDSIIATRGDTVIVSYEGKLVDGTIFDNSNSFKFQLGVGDVIKGWDQGIIGMKIGGKRKLDIPSKLGYGKRGSLPEIPPNSDLYFIVTLKKIIKN